MKLGRFIFTSPACMTVKLSTNKNLEIELLRGSEWRIFECYFSWKRKVDHAGPKFHIEIYKLLSFAVRIYDHRHWDDEQDQWQQKGTDVKRRIYPQHGEDSYQRMLKLLKLAAKYSSPNQNDQRIYSLGAVGVRDDGRIVHARNEAVFDTYTGSKRSICSVHKRFPESHAEARLTKKLGLGGTVYVARVARCNQELAMARPCESCQSILKAFRVNKVYYSISQNEWGMWDPAKNTDTFYGKQ